MSSSGPSKISSSSIKYKIPHLHKILNTVPKLRFLAKALRGSTEPLNPSRDPHLNTQVLAVQQAYTNRKDPDQHAYKQSNQDIHCSPSCGIYYRTTVVVSGGKFGVGKGGGGGGGAWCENQTCKYACYLGLLSFHIQ